MLKFVFKGFQCGLHNLNYYFIVEKYKKSLKLYKIGPFFKKKAKLFGRFLPFFDNYFFDIFLNYSKTAKDLNVRLTFF